MQILLGVVFMEPIVPRVEALLTHARDLAGQTCLYKSRGSLGDEVRAALHPEATTEAGQGIFMRIAVTTSGAVVRRPPLSQSGEVDRELLIADIENTKADVTNWFHEVV